MRPEEHKPYTKIEIVVIVILVIVGALVIGELNSTTTTIQSVSSGPLSISEYAFCQGFGEPVYYSSLDPDLNFTTYAYGHCYFGFWFANGHPLGYTTTTTTQSAV